MSSLYRIFFWVLTAAAFTDVAPAQSEPASIQDNSFLIEEAYNQEKGVVQHINTFMYFPDSGNWLYSFTQEWPVPGDARHQLSYTLAYSDTPDLDSHSNGIGDVLLNYRYQVLGNGRSRVAFAPRLSLIVPTGDSRFGRGFGGTGVQTNLPWSLVVTEKFVTHVNTGATYVGHAKDTDGNHASSWGYNAGHSIVWLAKPRFNVLLETSFNRTQVVIGRNHTDWSNSLFLNPGIRWAHNFKNGLQIVPGIAAPIGVGPSAGQRGLFVYLSFEHPFAKTDD